MEMNVHPLSSFIPLGGSPSTIRDQFSEFEKRIAAILEDGKSLAVFVGLEDVKSDKQLLDQLVETEKRRVDSLRLITSLNHYSNQYAEFISGSVNPASEIKQSLDLLEQSTYRFGSIPRNKLKVEDKRQLELLIADINNACNELARPTSILLKELRLVVLENDKDLPKRVRKTAADVEEIVSTISKSKDEAERIVSTLDDLSHKAALAEGIGTFASLGGKHKFYETCWLVTAIISAAATVVLYIFAIWLPLTSQIATNGSIPDPGAGRIAFEAIRRVILLSLPLVFLRIALTKYNQERHLRITYEHRTTVLKQYRSFEESMSSPALRDSFRFEIAKYIFSDPQTGYLDKDSSGEINFNPIISMAERASKTNP